MQFTIGRGDNVNFKFDDISISKVHAILTIEYYDDIEVEDSNSTNGTYINGTRIIRRKLQAGDQIKFGNYEPEMESFLKQVFDKYKGSKTDFIREFEEVLSVFAVYQSKKDKLVNPSHAALIMRIGFSVIAIGLLFLFQDYLKESIKLFSTLVIILANVVAGFVGPSPAKRSSMLDSLRKEYEDQLVCPKCNIKLIQNNLSYYVGREKCINPKCGACYR